MSLATRCTACGTVFRVVQDQLKVSEGWVRCGRCQDVFNALDGLFDLDRETPAPWQPTRPDSGGLGESVSGRTPLEPALPPRLATKPTSIKTALAGLSPLGMTIAPPAHAGTAAQATTVDIDLLLPDAQDTVDSRPDTLFDALIEQRAHPVDAAPPAPVEDAPAASEDSGDFVDARFNSQLFADDIRASDADTGAAAELPMAATAADAAVTPEFVREAERAARWESPRMRVGLWLAALLLAALLSIQVGLHFHDRLAAQWPGLREPLAVLCEVGGCQLNPPLRIDALSVESSSLTELADGNAYRLSVVLRNRAPHPVAAPSVDLSLTDANGRLIARRMISPREFTWPDAALPPATDTPWQSLLRTGEARIAGYTVEIFYP